jgi:hypothetical protein
MLPQSQFQAINRDITMTKDLTPIGQFGFFGCDF